MAESVPLTVPRLDNENELLHSKSEDCDLEAEIEEKNREIGHLSRHLFTVNVCLIQNETKEKVSPVIAT